MQHFLNSPPIHPLPFSFLPLPSSPYIDRDFWRILQIQKTKFQNNKKKKEKDVHFFKKICNNYVIVWYFFSIAYVAKNI